MAGNGSSLKILILSEGRVGVMCGILGELPGFSRRVRTRAAESVERFEAAAALAETIDDDANEST